MYTPNLLDIAQFDVADARAFVDFWNFISTEDHSIYFKELNVGNDLTEDNVRGLLRWKDSRWAAERLKNGAPNPKVVRVLKSLSVINQFRNDQITEDEMRRTADQVFPSGAVWKFFLLHIAKPHIYPLADVNAFRVCALHGRETKEPYTWKTYETYCDYFGLIAETLGVERTIENIRSLKRIDNALVKFGQFLGAYSPVVLKPVATNVIALPFRAGENFSSADTAGV